MRKVASWRAVRSGPSRRTSSVMEWRSIPSSCSLDSEAAMLGLHCPERRPAVAGLIPKLTGLVADHNLFRRLVDNGWVITGANGCRLSDPVYRAIGAKAAGVISLFSCLM